MSCGNTKSREETEVNSLIKDSANLKINDESEVNSSIRALVNMKTKVSVKRDNSKKTYTNPF
jgi:hypothetical protein